MEAAGEGCVDEVRAAGGVIVRDGRVAVVHRPRYDDWSLPKGKADRGESDEVCALREIEEETGLRCELLEELTSTRYRDARGRPKRVRWWLMRPLSGRFEASEEVDELRWLMPAEARELLSYSRDVALLDEACSSLDEALGARSAPFRGLRDGDSATAESPSAGN